MYQKNEIWKNVPVSQRKTRDTSNRPKFTMEGFPTLPGKYSTNQQQESGSSQVTSINSDTSTVQTSTDQHQSGSVSENQSTSVSFVSSGGSQRIVGI